MDKIDLTAAFVPPKIPDSVVAGGALLPLTVTPLALVVDYGLSFLS